MTMGTTDRWLRCSSRRWGRQWRAGIVCGPVHPKRHYRIKTRRLADPHLAPEEWVEAATKHDGSWWPALHRWLAAHSKGKTKPPVMGAPRKGYRVIEDAPGQYVRQR